MVKNEEISNKSIAITFKASRISSEVLQEVFRKFLAKIDERKRTGKQNMKTLASSGKNLSHLEVSHNNPKVFDKIAKEVNLDYTLLKDPSKENTYTIFVRSNDLDQLMYAMKKVTAHKMDGQEKPSVKQKLNKIKRQQRMEADTKDLDKSMKRKREKSLVMDR